MLPRCGISLFLLLGLAGCVHQPGPVAVGQPVSTHGRPQPFTVPGLGLDMLPVAPSTFLMGDDGAYAAYLKSRQAMALSFDPSHTNVC